MSSLFAFIAARRKALGYIVAAVAEYVTALLPQANPGNSQVLHGIVLGLGFLLVYLPENVKQGGAQLVAGLQKDPAIDSFINGLVTGDVPKHAAATPAPAPVDGPPAPAVAPAPQG